jgi:2-polyprenyl-6-hydroxyphenyl methylase / 3-demethylubiquinone-9 3-methyltransferase
MKTVVSLQDLVDLEIRPGRLLEEFRALTRTSVAALLVGPLVDVSCQGCGGAASSVAFEKLGLTYRLCATCASVFVSPRPTAAALAAYARSSPAATFWRERILRETLATRLDKLVRPRTEWVIEALSEYRPGARSGIDLSPQGGLLGDLAAESGALLHLVSIDPNAEPLAGPESVDCVAAFDVLDRAADVHGLVVSVRAALRPGGLFFVTAPSVSGFDLQVLWDRSPTMMPPDKLNVLSTEGFSRLFAAPEWEVIEFSTPGMFDVENVRQAMLADPGLDWPRGVREIVQQRDEAARLEFQEYLQRHRLASFARLVVRRR